MADTLEDLPVTSTWASVYTLSGITAGTSIFIQNKSSTPIVVSTGTQPTAASTKGFAVPSFEAVTVDGAPTNVWVRTTNDDRSGIIFVEAA